MMHCVCNDSCDIKQKPKPFLSILSILPSYLKIRFRVQSRATGKYGHIQTAALYQRNSLAAKKTRFHYEKAILRHETSPTDCLFESQIFLTILRKFCRLFRQ
jgi:hypothetical protein